MPMVSSSALLAIPGNSTVGDILLDIIGHFFSAALVAVVPIVGYRLLYKNIGEKEMTYIFFASWTYVVLSNFLGF